MKWIRWLVILPGFWLTLSVQTVQAEEVTPVLSPDDLANFRFQTPDASPAPTIAALTVGQQRILDAQRREIKDLIARKLGVMRLRGDASDLATLQALHDRKILVAGQTQEWQYAGILLGDILAREFGLTWVTYEDQTGVSKALQWRDSQNFVFPVTVFSRRLQYGEPLDMQRIYQQISSDVREFIAYERRLKG